MLYGHYLQKPKQNMAVVCVAISKLRKDHGDFMAEVERRWQQLEEKRGFRSKEDEIASKRRKGVAGFFPTSSTPDPDSSSGTAGAVTAGESDHMAGEKNDQRPLHFLPAEEKRARREACQTAWDNTFVSCGIPFAVADNPQFREALKCTRQCPDFKIACRQTMGTTRLDKLHDEANRFKAMRLRSGIDLGFVITSDGWRSCAKKNYHNYILISVEGPIFLSLVEVTGESATGEDIKKGFEDQFAKLEASVLDNIMIGITDTPTANQKAWRLLEAMYPKQIWIACAAHEISLLFKEWVKKVDDILTLFREGHRIVKWVNNHAEILKLYRAIIPSHFTEDKRRHSIMLYTPGDT